MLIGSSMAEGAHGLVWTDLNGKKLKGVASIGSTYAGATRLTLDKAGQSQPFIAYGLASSVVGDVQLVGIGQKANTLLFSRKEEIPQNSIAQGPARNRRSVPNHPEFGGYGYLVSYAIGGLAVHNGLAAISFPKKNEIIFITLQSKVLYTGINMMSYMACLQTRMSNPLYRLVSVPGEAKFQRKRCLPMWILSAHTVFPIFPEGSGGFRLA